MKRSLAVGVVLWLAGPAAAGVEGSHHDMRQYDRLEEKSVCVYCHVPHRAATAENLFAGTSSVSGLGPVGTFCYSCHDGTVVPTALIEAPDGTVGLAALTHSHGFDISRMDDVSEGLERPEQVYGSGLVPLNDDGSRPDVLDCDACHDPHDNTNPPFLKAPLEELCTRCHSGQDGLGRGRWTSVEDSGDANWAHPVGMPVHESGFDHVRGRASEMTFHEPDPVYRVPTPSPRDLVGPQAHWATGGHLLGSDEVVGCPTCHSVHLPVENLLVSQVAEDPRTSLCAGCHGSVDNPENPGSTPYYHPVFDSSKPPYEHDHAEHGDVGNPNIPATGTLDLFVEIPPDWPLSDDGSLLCVTCHRSHRGTPGERCLRGMPDRALVICNECHGVGDDTRAFNRHHPVGLEDYTAPANGGFPVQLAWYQGKELPGDLSDGLQCVDCHTELAKSGHNW